MGTVAESSAPYSVHRLVARLFPSRRSTLSSGARRPEKLACTHLRDWTAAFCGARRDLVL